MMLRPAVAAISLAVALPTALAQAPSPASPSDAPAQAPAQPAAATAVAAEGTEKKRRLRFRDDKNACAPGALGEADIKATLTAKPTNTESPKKRSDK